MSWPEERERCCSEAGAALRLETLSGISIGVGWRHAGHTACSTAFPLAVNLAQPNVSNVQQSICSMIHPESDLTIK